MNLSIFDPSDYFFNPHAIPYFVAGLLVFMEGIFIFLQNRKSLLHVSFTLTDICVGIWLTGVGIFYCARYEEVALFWDRNYVWVGAIFICPFIHLFSASWRNSVNEQRKLIAFNFVSAVVLCIFSTTSDLFVPAMWKTPWGFYTKGGIIVYLFPFWFYTIMIFSFMNFFKVYRKEGTPIRKKQAKLIIIAFAIAFIGSLDFLPNYQIVYYPWGFLPILVWVSMIGYSIIRYKLLDIQTVAHKTIMWAVTSVLFTGPLILFSYLGRNWLLSLGPASFSSVVFGLVVLFIIYARLVQPRIDHAFQRRRWDLAAGFEKFTDELVHLRGLEELTTHIVGTIRSVFYVEEISLLLSKDENGAFESVKSVPEERRLRFERSHPFVSWLETCDLLVLREYLDLDPKYESIKEAAKEYLETVNAHVCVPLVVSQRLLGVINIGQKANLRRFGTAEINFISDLRKTAAIALSNSLRSIAMQESLRQWNVELEKKVEERTRELKETQHQLIQAEKLASIGTLAGGIAHEINNPLTAVLTNAQILKMTGEVKDTESLDLIEEGAKRCRMIIQKLMRYARKTGEIENYESVDINKVIRSVADLLGYQLKQENIDLNLSLEKLDPIAGIPNELEQVFTNLILNSKDAICAAGRKGKIEIVSGQKNGAVKIEVMDNGIGIKKEHLARVFDPFYTTKDVGEGTGLGLTVSSGIVEKHLGKISVSSEEGHGTTFTIRFPVGKEKERV